MENNKFPTAFVIFGATGDLFNKKLVPAIFNLFKKNLLPESFLLIGFARKNLSQKEFQKLIENIILNYYPQTSKNIISSFLGRSIYIQGDFNHKKSYQNLARFLGYSDKEWQTCANKLFYLAVPPKYYKTIFKNLHKNNLHLPCKSGGGWTKILVEKPFGRDFKTAKELDELLGQLFFENQIYRIDHYLAKETVQNILTFRFSNSIFEPLWNKNNIEKIYIKFYEKSGILGRGEFYDGVGALRDIGQNHILQLLALFTMEKPNNFSPEVIRQKRAEILKKLKIFKLNEVKKFTIRGQYANYLNEPGVKSNSLTETYFKILAFLDDANWRNVPIYLEGGKNLGENKVEIEITFRHKFPCLCLENNHLKNVLSYEIQPQEKISISFFAKKPNSSNIVLKNFLFDYRHSFAEEEFLDAYEKLLFDAFSGNQTLFVSTEEILFSWKFIDAILSGWRKNKSELQIYSAPSEILNKQFEFEKNIKKEIGIIGLGKMGYNLALNLLDKNWQVFGYDKNFNKNEENKIKISSNLKELVLKLQKPRVILLSLPHQIVFEVLFEQDGLINYLEKGDIIIDGGNSFYKNSQKIYKKLKKIGINFLDVGISGGPSGARYGPSLMIGGDKKVFEEIEYLFKDLACPGGYTYFGKSGAGHFIKMIHNGIEYGIMQAIAEGFNLIKIADFNLNLKKVAELYNNGSVIESKLINWLRLAYEKYGQNLEEVSGSPAYTGEGEWTVNFAEKLKQSAPVIKAAFEFRVKSKNNPNYIGKIIQALRNQFGGHSIK
ncbi:MAG: glucose-6-phosphate dehydrogenase [Minisyncoccia bacterium]